jgi:hypothetical protein
MANGSRGNWVLEGWENSGKGGSEKQIPKNKKCRYSLDWKKLEALCFSLADGTMLPDLLCFAYTHPSPESSSIPVPVGPVGDDLDGRSPAIDARLLPAALECASEPNKATQRSANISKWKNTRLSELACLVQPLTTPHL